MHNTQVQSTTKRIARVLADYQAAYSDPISMGTGEELQLSGKQDSWNGWIWLWCINQAGKSGWVPLPYIQIVNNRGKALCDYDATELSVSKGQFLLVEKEESGWFWCSTQQDKKGWVPVECLEILQ